MVTRRGKSMVTIDSQFGATAQLASKLDISPPPWLAAVRRQWVPMPIHHSYGGPLPSLTCTRLEENLAEKIARLNRTTTARDIYDLVWIWQVFRRQPAVTIDTALIRRLAVLKMWVDANGLSAEGTAWKPGHESFPFDPDRWLRSRPAREFDTEDIGQLAVPPPDLDDLGRDLTTSYSFLRDLDPDERNIADLHGSHRQRVLRMLAGLDGGRLGPGTCW
ncbi:MAG TPA: nucleotidyl transferase AbiEii/AbiGii toxin family protein [Kribbella sp.]|uniref:nucleotidyl transferase AbiEii/AbiGii toxin family protein n=1 Tax=Kribbella sp. TaxID=1871183 RepID=UPI002D7663CA|nr:nucleotidyl transferase AbiEii/AbiGii toxin family protein [Kribbella sp.]HET6295256.1 nucleotidyl transferase AbiEii/AbiGii toxin family protein [Kribbella sp.]